MRTLNRLAQLHLVADQRNVSCAGGHSSQVAKRNLSGFVDEQIVKRLVMLRPGKQPRCSGDEVEGLHDLIVVVDVRYEPRVALMVFIRALLETVQADTLLRRDGGNFLEQL